MLLRLKRPANLSERIQPLALERDCSSSHTRCHILGWGKTEYGQWDKDNVGEGEGQWVMGHREGRVKDKGDPMMQTNGTMDHWVKRQWGGTANMGVGPMSE